MSEHDQTSRDAGSPGSPGPDIAVQVPPKHKPARPKRRELPPFKLVLHNDEVNAMEDVVLSIVKVTPLNPARAIRKMLEAHASGTAVLLVTHKERGELYVQQFAGLKITTTLEPDC